MRGRVKLLLVLATAAIISAQPASAKDSPRDSKDPKDPNEKICEKQSVLGSRLTTRRVCATRSEWAEKRQQDKDAVDQAQRSACLPSAGC
jgi:predicted secreted protein